MPHYLIDATNDYGVDDATLDELRGDICMAIRERGTHTASEAADEFGATSDEQMQMIYSHMIDLLIRNLHPDTWKVILQQIVWDTVTDDDAPIPGNLPTHSRAIPVTAHTSEEAIEEAIEEFSNEHGYLIRHCLPTIVAQSVWWRD